MICCYYMKNNVFLYYHGSYKFDNSNLVNFRIFCRFHHNFCIDIVLLINDNQFLLLQLPLFVVLGIKPRTFHAQNRHVALILSNIISP